MKIFAVYDRDYFCDEEIADIEMELAKELTGAHILARKEMENYLLNLEVLQRVMQKQLEQKNRRQGTNTRPPRTIHQYLVEITEPIRLEVQSQYLARKLAYHRSSGADASTLSIKVMQEFEARWSDLKQRMWIVPGKSVLRALRDSVQGELGINLTLIQIVDEFDADEIPVDLRDLLQSLEEFRKS
jgi:hypothetical protein